MCLVKEQFLCKHIWWKRRCNKKFLTYSANKMYKMREFEPNITEQSFKSLHSESHRIIPKYDMVYVTKRKRLTKSITLPVAREQICTITTCHALISYGFSCENYYIFDFIPICSGWYNLQLVFIWMISRPYQYNDGIRKIFSSSDGV